LVEEDQLTGGNHKDHSKPERSLIPTAGAGKGAGTKSAAGAKADVESDYVTQLIRYRRVVGQYVATGLSEAVRKAVEKGITPEGGTEAGEGAEVGVRILKISNCNSRDITPTHPDLRLDLDCKNEEDKKGFSGESLADLKTMETDLSAMQITPHTVKLTDKADDGPSSNIAKPTSPSAPSKPTADAASISPPPAPVPVPAPSSSSWSSRVGSLLPTIPIPGFLKSGKESHENKGVAMGKEATEHEADLQLSKAKNDGLITLFEEFW
jgi:hypothetical protein